MRLVREIGRCTHAAMDRMNHLPSTRALSIGAPREPCLHPHIHAYIHTSALVDDNLCPELIPRCTSAPPHLMMTDKAETTYLYAASSWTTSFSRLMIQSFFGIKS
jgi:hypothetical protein